MVVFDWDRVAPLLTDLSFLQGKNNPELFIYARKASGVLLEDLQKRYKTYVHKVPQAERNFSNYMSCSVIYEFAKRGEYNKILFVFEGKGLGSTQTFLEAQGIAVENISLGSGDSRTGRGEARGRERGREQPGRERNDRRNERPAEQRDKREQNRPQREPRAEQAGEERKDSRNARDGRTGSRRDQRDKPGRTASYTPTEEDAAKMAARMRENFNLFKDYNSDQLTLILKQATDHSSQDIFGTKSPKPIVRGLTAAGFAEEPEERKFRLTDYPDARFYADLFAGRVRSKPKPRPEVEINTEDDDAEEPNRTAAVAPAASTNSESDAAANAEV